MGVTSVCFEKSLKYVHSNGDVAQTLSNSDLDTETLAHSKEWHTPIYSGGRK